MSASTVLLSAPGAGSGLHLSLPAVLAAGGLVRSLGITLAGHALGSQIPNIDHYLLPIVAVVVISSLVPIGVELVRDRRRAVTR